LSPDSAPGRAQDAREAGRRADPLRWEHKVAAGLMALMALIAFANVLSRYLLHYSLSFTEEITINLFVWLCVIGSGLAFERGSQLGMVSIHNRLPVRARAAVCVLSAVLGALLFIVVDVFLIHTIYYEMTVFRAASPALGIPVWAYYAPVPVLSLAVGRGIYRGLRRELRELSSAR
jgi:TRAP-type C4-dicarboxylate transport system permease small subunit